MQIIIKPNFKIPNKLLNILELPSAMQRCITYCKLSGYSKITVDIYVRGVKIFIQELKRSLIQ